MYDLLFRASVLFHVEERLFTNRSFHASIAVGVENKDGRVSMFFLLQTNSKQNPFWGLIKTVLFWVFCG